MDQTIGSAFSDAYPALLRLARSRLARESAPISTRTLAHELYLDLQGQAQALHFTSQAQFMAYAARAMRSLLVDMARQRLAEKRHAECLPLTFADGVADAEAGRPEAVLALNQALERLGQLEPRLMQVAELRALLGLEVPEVAQALGLSEPTVKRDWQRARAFLLDQLSGSAG